MILVILLSDDTNDDTSDETSDESENSGYYIRLIN